MFITIKPVSIVKIMSNRSSSYDVNRSLTHENVNRSETEYPCESMLSFPYDCEVDIAISQIKFITYDSCGYKRIYILDDTIIDTKDNVRELLFEAGFNRAIEKHLE